MHSPIPWSLAADFKRNLQDQKIEDVAANVADIDRKIREAIDPTAVRSLLEETKNQSQQIRLKHAMQQNQSEFWGKSLSRAAEVERQWFQDKKQQMQKR